MKHQPISPTTLDASDMRIGVVTSRYYAEVTTALRNGASDAFRECGGDPDRLLHIESPGTWELPVLCSGLLRASETFDAVVAIGCVIAGETSHDRYINSGVSDALARLAVRTSTPVAFGVLTCSSMEQALARAGGDVGNKGRESMLAAIDAAATIRSLDRPEATT